METIRRAPRSPASAGTGERQKSDPAFPQNLCCPRVLKSRPAGRERTIPLGARAAPGPVNLHAATPPPSALVLFIRKQIRKIDTLRPTRWRGLWGRGGRRGQSSSGAQAAGRWRPPGPGTHGQGHIPERGRGSWEGEWPRLNRGGDGEWAGPLIRSAGSLCPPPPTASPTRSGPRGSCVRR